MVKRFRAIVAALTVLALVFMPFGPFKFAVKPAKAEPADNFAGGTGVLGDPYQITTCLQLQEMRNDSLSGKYFILANDINCAATSISDPDDPDYNNNLYHDGAGFSPIGYYDYTAINPSHGFYGDFDGRGHTISNLFINHTNQSSYDHGEYVSLFGYSGGAKIKNLSLTDVNITGLFGTAGLVSYTGSTIDNVSVSGTVSGGGRVGMVVGFTETGHFSRLSASGTVNISQYNGWAGGLFGLLYGDSVLIDSHSNVNVVGSSYNSGLGGLAGATWGNPSIVNCYSLGTVGGASSSNVGGLVGEFGYSGHGGTITNSFANSSSILGASSVGGLVGLMSAAPAENAFSTDYFGSTSADSCVSGDTQYGCNSGSTSSWTGETKGAPESAWNFTNIWHTSEDYPALKPNIAISSCQDLQDINLNLSGNFVLAGNISCTSETHSGGDLWNSGIGFTPIGDSTNPFVGTFDGQGYTISGLYINRDSGFNVGVGLFGVVSSEMAKPISNVGLLDIDITGDYWGTGGLVGILNGPSTAGASAQSLRTISITNSYVYGNSSITATDASIYTGGLIGTINYSANYTKVNLANCYTQGTVSGKSGVGGIVGYVSNHAGRTVADFSLTDSYSVASVSGSFEVGGLIGWNCNIDDARITTSHFSGQVSSSSDSVYVGGLVGLDENTIDRITNVFMGGRVVTESSSFISYLIGGASDADIASHLSNVYYFNDGSAWWVAANPLRVFAGFAETDWSYFLSTNSSSSPMNTWDLDSTWTTGQSLFPRLRGLSFQNFIVGEGTVVSPYEVRTCPELASISTDLVAYFKLDNDLLCGIFGKGMIIGSQSTAFSGHFNGQGHTVDLNISYVAHDYIGLFAALNGANIMKLRLTGLVIGGSSVGALAGLAYNSVISQVANAASVTGGSDGVGGLVGKTQSDVAISDSYNTALIYGANGTGGIVGNLGGNSTISRSYNIGKVMNGSYVGGLAGRAGATDVTAILDSFSTGTIPAVTSGNGAIIGVGFNADATIARSYYDTSRSGQSGCGYYYYNNESGAHVDPLPGTTCSGVNAIVDGVWSAPSYFKNTSNAHPFKNESNEEVWDFSGNDSVWVTTTGYPALRSLSLNTTIVNDSPSLLAAPTNFGLSDSGTDYISLDWSAPTPSNDYSAITNYNVQYRETGTDSWTDHITGWTGTSVTISGLNSGTLYDFQVQALNAAGGGSFTDPLTYTTSAPPLPVVPAGIYHIKTCQELQDITSLDSTYYLDNSIDCSNVNESEGFNSIGQDDEDGFVGTFNGQGYSIEGLLTNGLEEFDVGLFSVIGESGVVKNLNIIDADISGYNNTGTLAGENYGEVINVSGSGTIYGEGEIGGLIGENDGTIRNSNFVGTVIAIDHDAGGLAGDNYGEIYNSFSAGQVYSPSCAGGLVCYNSQSINSSYSSAEAILSDGGMGAFYGGLAGYNDGSVYDSYSTGDVSGSSDVGGFVGYNEGWIEKAYAVGHVVGTGSFIGGFVGQDDDGETYSFFDTSTTGQLSDGVNASGLATSSTDMKTESTFTEVGWDFNGLWKIDETNGGYPHLVWQDMQGVQSVGDATFESGGTTEFPWLISNVNELEFANYNLSDSYKLGASFSALEAVNWNDGDGFLPIGWINSDVGFTGVFDGAGYTISDLIIDLDGGDGVGLFYWLDGGAVVENLGLTDVSIYSEYNAAGLAGYIENDNGSEAGIHVKNVHVTGSISASDQIAGGLAGYNDSDISGCSFDGEVISQSYTGGLIGENYGNVKDSFTSGRVTGSDEVGGLIGENNSDIEASYSNATVDINEDSEGTSIGGLVGWNGGNIYDSYATGSVTGNDYVGGLVGYHEGNIERTYATGLVVSSGNYVGGLIGEDDDGDSYSFFDTTTTGQSVDGPGAAGAPTSIQDMKTDSTFIEAGWDFNGLWKIDEKNDGYPHLVWQDMQDEEGVNDTLFKSGGTTEFPWMISNVNELQFMNYALTDSFKLGEEIEAAATQDWEWSEGNTGFSPIAVDSDAPFTGTFDGNSYSIDDLYINFPNSQLVGLFAQGQNVNIKNLEMKNASVSGGIIVGALIGIVGGTSQISNIKIDADVTGYVAVGGLAGYITNDDSSCEVDLDKIAISGSVVGIIEGDSGFYIGGIAGIAATMGVIKLQVSDSYSQASVSGTVDIGGLFGILSLTSDSHIQNNYSSGDVSGSEDIGGIAGHFLGGVFENNFAAGRVTASDSYAGGIFGVVEDESDLAVISNNYYDNQAGENVADCAGNVADFEGGIEGCTAVDTALLPVADYGKGSDVHDSSPFDQWNFDDTWLANDSEFPTLNQFLDLSNPVVNITDTIESYPGKDVVTTATVTNAISYSWSKQWGNFGNATFDSATSKNTKVSFDDYGAYLLRLDVRGRLDSTALGFQEVLVHQSGDINGDGVVDELDFAALLTNWGSTTSEMANFNNDSVVDELDFAKMLTHWGVVEDWSSRSEIPI
ncbi:MAG: fibronectin type III domain-containing protein [Candidatus Berkelbacteria bacterium]|nr:fibronectin type III domain-containing protein [Candidatus Berkelbacteria bacterium]